MLPSKERNGRAYLSQEFVEAVKRDKRGMGNIYEWSGIKYKCFLNWATQVNKVAKDNPLILRLAQSINFNQEQIFE